MIPEIGSEENLARGITQRVEEYFGPPFLIGNQQLRVTARLGIAVFPNDGTDAETLSRNAEAAVSRAKARGERYLFYRQEMTEKIAGTLALENRLRQALENNEFVLHYQPKVDAHSGRILSVEALIRWQHPERGLLMPDAFIPVAEQRRLMLDFLVLEIKLGEKPHFRFEDFRLERLGHVIDRAERIAFEDVLLVAARGGNENDRRVLRAFAFADQLGEFETVESGHLDVEQDEGDILGQQVAQRFVSR